MTTLIFGARGGFRTLVIHVKVALGPPFCWPVSENPSSEVATKDHSSSTPPKVNTLDLETQVDAS